MVSSGLFREEALSIVKRYLNVDEDDSNEYSANLQSSKFISMYNQMTLRRYKFAVTNRN